MGCAPALGILSRFEFLGHVLQRQVELPQKAFQRLGLVDFAGRQI